MPPSRVHPARSSTLLGVALVTLTVAAGVGLGTLANAIAPDVPEGDAESQGLVTSPNDDTPSSTTHNPPQGLVAPIEAPPEAQPMQPAQPVRHPPSRPRRIRTRTS